MATCGICASFDIVIEGAALNVAKTFVAPSSFTVISCIAFNIAAAARTLTLAGSTAGTFTATTAAPPIAGPAIVGSNATGAGGEPTQQVAIFAANANITEGETITVTANNASITKVVIRCVRNPVTGTSPPGSPISIA